MDNEAHRFDSGEGWPCDYRNVGQYLSASAPIMLPKNPLQEPTAHNIYCSLALVILSDMCLSWFQAVVGPGLLHLTSAFSGQAAS